jgi:hypothetical protein
VRSEVLRSVRRVLLRLYWFCTRRMRAVASVPHALGMRSFEARCEGGATILLSVVSIIDIREACRAPGVLGNARAIEGQRYAIRSICSATA